MTSDENLSGLTFAYPVRYMPILQFSFLGYKRYKIIDTSYEGQGKTVRGWLNEDDAYWLTKWWNNLEGYRYG